MIVYEYPFNERIRTLLRLENLYHRFVFFLQQESYLQHHVALTTIFEMLEVVGRGDLKSDLLQELERQKQILYSYQSNPAVESGTLNQILAEIEQISAALSNLQGKTGQHLREHEWLMSIRGRASIPGGACEFDLPSYYTWQQQDADKRRNDITHWFMPLQPFFDAVCIVVRLLRESVVLTKQMTAIAGNFQLPLHGKNYQMARATLDSSLGAVPEVSANKYVLMVRFVNQDMDTRAKAFDSDVPFELSLCGF